MSLPRKMLVFWLAVMAIAVVLWTMANKGSGSQRPAQSETRQQ